MMTGEHSLPIPVNPYVGPRAFEEQERDYFFGRDEETSILVGFVMARRVTLFFAQSGAGKSSLLWAGLIPEVTRPQTIQLGRRTHTTQKMRVLPMVNVGRAPLNSALPASPNLYVFNALVKLLPTVPPDVLAGLDLSAGLAQYMAGQAAPPDAATPLSAPLFSTTDSANPTLLIFDQFEELFTAYAARRVEQADFFQQINQALTTYVNLHVLFSMREDYIAELTPYTHLLPEQLRHRYRLERLKRPAALLAVREPAARAGRSYADGVAESLVDNLARTQLKREQQKLAGDSATPIPLIGEEVEPVHLQIVCRQLWANLPADHLTIQAQDVQDFGDVDRALRDFYTVTLQQTGIETGISERQLRDWFNEHLITPARTRGLVYRDDSKGVTAGLPNVAVDRLRDAYLIRANLRGGDIWYELAHDRLIEPVLAANQAWLVKYVNPLLAPTQLWLQNNQDPARLLRDPQLSIAQQFATAHALDLLAEEREFLDESLRLHTREEQAAARRRNILAISLLMGLVVLGLIVWSIYSTVQRRQKQTEVLAGQLAAASTAELQSANYDIGMLLAIEAGHLAPTRETYNALHNAFNQQVRTIKIFREHRAAITQVAWSPDGTRLLSTSQDGTAWIWPTNGSGKPLKLVNSLGQQVNGGAWNHAGTQVLTYAGPTVQVWDAKNGALLFARQADTATVLFTDWNSVGTRFLTTSDNGFVRIWSADTDRPIFAWPAHTPTMATYAVWNHSENSLLTTGGDSKVRVWTFISKTNSITNSLTLTGHIESVQMARWNRDETRILTASLDRTARVWDAISGAEKFRLVHNDAVLQATWSQDGSRILTAGFDKIVRIWDATRGAPLLTLPGHEGAVRTALWSEDGQRILTAGDDTPPQVWDAQSGALLNRLGASSTAPGAYVAVWNNDGSLVATGSPDGEVHIWQLSMHGELPIIRYSTNELIPDVTWNRTETKILTAGADQFASVWDAQTGSRLITLVGHSKRIYQARWNEDESAILTVSSDGIARVWDVRTRTEQAKLESPNHLVTLAQWDNHDQFITTLDANFSANLFHVRKWDANHLDRLPVTLIVHNGFIETARWNKNYTRLVTASQDGSLCLWDGATAKPICARHAETITPEITVHEAKWNADDSLILSYSDDNTARIWDAKTLKAQLTFQHGGPVTAASWNKAESLLLTASKDGTARIWDAKSNALPTKLTGHVGPVLFALWNQAETQILTAGEDGTARVWNNQGKLLFTLWGHRAAINGVSWSPDESLILTYSNDSTARLWDANNGSLITVLTGHRAPIRLALWNKAGTRILTASDDGTVRQYYVYMDDLLRAACQSVARSMTHEEWQRYFGNKKYDPTCIK